MPYRRTEQTRRRLSARRCAILAAAREIVARSGFAGLSMDVVAAGSGVATGTLYRYFPSKADLCTEIVTEISDHELAVLDRVAASDAAPRERLALAIRTFSGRALAARTLAYALMAEPVLPEVDTLRLRYRGELAAVLSGLIGECIAEGTLPPQNAAASAAFMVGAFIEGVIAPHGPELPAPARRALVDDIADFCLRGAGAVQPSGSTIREGARRYG